MEVFYTEIVIGRKSDIHDQFPIVEDIAIVRATIISNVGPASKDILL
jgi:hypothetical protein